MSTKPRSYMVRAVTLPPTSVLADAWDRVLREVRADAPEPDPLIADLVRLLNDSRLSDALAESVRAQLGETVYQLRVMVGEVAA